MTSGFRYPNRIVDVARLWPEMQTPKGRLVGRWEQMIALLERRDQALEDYLTTLPVATGGGKDWSTVVIAASDSHAGVTADYICDGVDDQVQVQAAIDGLPTVFGLPRGEIVSWRAALTFQRAWTVNLPFFGAEVLGTEPTFTTPCCFLRLDRTTCSRTQQP